MDPELKARWIEALKSGAYKKGRNALRPCDDAYCCLGVLANEIDPDAWQKLRDGSGHNAWYWRNGLWSSFIIGNNQEIVPGLYEDDQTRLMSLNDTCETWEEVVDYIEEYL